MIIIKRLLLFGFAVVALHGCASTPELVSRPGLTVLPGSELPPPTDNMLAGGGRVLTVGPGDKLVIEVFGMPELSDKHVVVDAAGMIYFPIAGGIQAAGRTTADIAEDLRTGLRKGFVRDPQPSVNLEQIVSQVVTVDGEVGEPGRYPVLGRMTLTGAIASAKGTTEFSRLSHVIVYRHVGGQRLAALYNLRAIREGAYDDPLIFANDTVVVGDAAARRLFRDILQAVPLVTTPIVAAITYRR